MKLIRFEFDRRDNHPPPVASNLDVLFLEKNNSNDEGGRHAQLPTPY